MQQDPVFWKLRLPLVMLMLAGGLHALAAAGSPVLVPGEARSALFQSEVRHRSDELTDLAEFAAGDAAIVAELETVLADPDLDPVSKDAVLYEFVRQLRQLEPWSVGPDVFEWLRGHQPLAVRLHEESPVHTVALFNVAAAAHGLHNQWTFEAARTRWRDVRGAVSAESLAIFLVDPDSPRARGYLSAIPDLSPAALDHLAGLVEADSMLSATALLPRLELARGNTDRVTRWLAQADPRLVHATMREAAAVLDPAEAVAVFRGALQHQDSSMRALALAQVSDVVVAWNPLARETWQDELIELLPDPQLGAGAALQLARLADSAWLERQRERQDLPAEVRQRLDLVESLKPMLDQRSTRELQPW